MKAKLILLAVLAFAVASRSWGQKLQWTYQAPLPSIGSYSTYLGDVQFADSGSGQSAWIVTRYNSNQTAVVCQQLFWLNTNGKIIKSIEVDGSIVNSGLWIQRIIPNILYVGSPITGGEQITRYKYAGGKVVSNGGTAISTADTIQEGTVSYNDPTGYFWVTVSGTAVAIFRFSN
jgi:hypothetical protein